MIVSESPIPLVDKDIVDCMYSKYCHSDQPVNGGGSEIEIERSSGETDSDTETTDGSEVRCDL